MKSEGKLRKELTTEGAAVLIYHVSQRTKPIDQWRPFYNDYVNSMLKGLESGQRRRIRIGLAGKGYMRSRIRLSNKGRQETLVLIDDDCYRKIFEKFGPIEMDSKGAPVIPPEKPIEVKAERLTAFNPASIGSPMQNSFEWDEEITKRREKARQAKLSEEQKVKEGKEAQKAKDKDTLKRLKAFGMSGVSAEAQNVPQVP